MVHLQLKPKEGNGIATDTQKDKDLVHNELAPPPLPACWGWPQLLRRLH